MLSATSFMNVGAVVTVNPFNWERFTARVESRRGASKGETQAQGFFAEFMEVSSSNDSPRQRAVAAASPGINASRSLYDNDALPVAMTPAAAASSAAAASTLEDEIAAAVESVIGRVVDRTEPLVDAGVDSLVGHSTNEHDSISIHPKSTGLNP
jgi:hypothetical protein